MRRYAELIKKNAISGSIKEQADSDLASNAARIRSLEAQKETYVAQLATLVSKRKSAQALILMKKAALDIAMLDLEYTRICAPYDGYIGRRTIEPGEFVQAGQTIANFTDGKNKWVTANYKETQIASIREGQKVIIHVDAFPGETFNGTVSAISASHASFGAALTEAYLMLQDQYEEVLVVDCDGAVPEFYHPHLTAGEFTLPFASAWLLRRGSSLEVSCTATNHCDGMVELPASLAAWRVLSQGTTECELTLPGQHLQLRLNGAVTWA